MEGKEVQEVKKEVQEVENKIHKNCIYKLKDGKRLDGIIESVSKHVIVQGFSRKPLGGINSIYCVYSHIDINSLDYVSNIINYHIMEYEDFKDYFELFTNREGISNKIIELNSVLL